MTKTMKDSAFPTKAGPVTDIVLIYAGGDTPHPWTTADIMGMPERYRFPTWVRSNPAGFSGFAEGALFAAWLASHHVPSHTAVCLDLETAVATTYVNEFNQAMRAIGHPLIKYGSKGFIFKNPKTDGGTFVADPTGQSHMVATGDTVMTQYAFNGGFDLSLVEDSVPLWDTKPSPPPPPPHTGALISGPVKLPGYADHEIYFNAQLGTVGYHDAHGNWHRLSLPRAVH